MPKSMQRESFNAKPKQTINHMYNVYNMIA